LNTFKQRELSLEDGGSGPTETLTGPFVTTMSDVITGRPDSIGPTQLTYNLVIAIGVTETNRGRSVPIAKDSILTTVAGVRASLKSVHQTIVASAITTLRKHEELRVNTSTEPFRGTALTSAEFTQANNRAIAVTNLLTSVQAAVPAKAIVPVADAQVDQYIAQNAAKISAAGMSADNVRTMFKAVILKNKVDVQHAFVAAGTTLGEAVARIPVGERLGISESSLKTYIRDPSNWGENAAAWQRVGVQNLPNNLGQRIEAFATADNGYRLATANTADSLNMLFDAAGCSPNFAACPLNEFESSSMWPDGRTSIGTTRRRSCANTVGSSAPAAAWSTSRPRSPTCPRTGPLAPPTAPAAPPSPTSPATAWSTRSPSTTTPSPYDPPPVSSSTLPRTGPVTASPAAVAPSSPT
jgi:hypothetical protein